MTAVGRAGLRPARPGGVPDRRGLVAAVLPPVVFAVLVVAGWWVASSLADSTVFPAPPDSLRTLREALGRSDFRDSLGQSLRLLAESYGAAVVVGAVAGISLGLSRFFSDAVAPILYAVNSVPKVVLYPVFLIFLGLGDPSRSAFAFVSGVIPMLLVVLESAGAVSRVHLKLAASLELSYAQVIRKIIVPSLVPGIATGARLTFGLTFLGLLLAEMFSGSGGLGYELLRNITLVRLEDILGEVVLIAVVSLVPTLLLRWVETMLRRRYST